MAEDILISLAAVVVLGIAAQYISWRMRLPAILLLLVFGILAGPVARYCATEFGWPIMSINSDKLFGDLLFPIVSLSVAIILFEGGLSLKISELKGTGQIIWSLVTAGASVCWIITAAAAYWILDMQGSMAILLGAVLIVTGPTVIVPLLRHVRPNKTVGSILKWEGIVIDPIGAIMALLVFEMILQGSTDSFMHSIFALFKTIIVGVLIGYLGAVILTWSIKKHLVPDLLENSIVLMIVIGLYVLSNTIQHESGLFAVTVMGIILANQKWVSIERIVHFKEDLRVLLISMLFIILSARLTIDNFSYINWQSILFLAALIFVGRPAAIAVSTIGSKLSWRERLFLAWMAPRGIVAAAVSSIFALRLQSEGYDQAADLMPLTFLVIIGTVGFYGLTASAAGRWLKVTQPNPQGLLILGAHERARLIAKAIQDEKFNVILADTNWHSIQRARMLGIPAIYGSVFSDNVLENVEMGGIGRLLALTSNHEVNSLAAVRFSKVFDRKEVYQLPAEHPAKKKAEEEKPSELQGRTLFGKEITYNYLYRRVITGAIIKKTKLSEEFTFESFKEMYGDNTVLLFIVNDQNKLQLETPDTPLNPKAGDTIICLVDPTEEAPKKEPDKSTPPPSA